MSRRAQLFSDLSDSDSDTETDHVTSHFRKRRNLAPTEFIQKTCRLEAIRSSSGVFYTLMILTALLTGVLSADYDRTDNTIQRAIFLALMVTGGDETRSHVATWVVLITIATTTEIP